MSKRDRINVYPTIPGDQLEWRAGPDVARALGMTTETLYPWLDAMGVQRIEIASSKVLVDMPALAEALKLWAKVERGAELTLEEWGLVESAVNASKASTGAFSVKLATQYANAAGLPEKLAAITDAWSNLSDDEKRQKLSAAMEQIRAGKQQKSDQ